MDYVETYSGRSASGQTLVALGRRVDTSTAVADGPAGILVGSSSARRQVGDSESHCSQVVRASGGWHSERRRDLDQANTFASADLRA